MTPCKLAHAAAAMLPIAKAKLNNYYYFNNNIIIISFNPQRMHEGYVYDVQSFCVCLMS